MGFMISNPIAARLAVNLLLHRVFRLLNRIGSEAGSVHNPQAPRAAFIVPSAVNAFRILPHKFSALGQRSNKGDAYLIGLIPVKKAAKSDGVGRKIRCVHF
jgi:hypothetical protein